MIHRRSNLFAIAAMALATAAASANPGAGAQQKKGVDCDTIASIRIVTPFTLDETSRTEVNDCTSRSTYTGQGVLEYAACDTENPTAPTQVNARVDLRTTTVLNDCGSGFTDGTFTLTLLDASGNATDSIEGTLTAVNQNFGELQGILEGTRKYRNGGKDGNYSLNLRAAFSAAFVSPDNDGVYDAVSISSANGVLSVPNKSANPNS